ncbi:MAG TPA: antitermination regulator, partial [Lachnospiraceae bacterium]|nr:antitermination regulator [Lachnospiraceae bacterium]
MVSIIIALPKMENARQIRDILNRHGFETAAVTTTGAGALAAVSQLEAGVVISGIRFCDMYYIQLLENLPDGFELLVLGSVRDASGYRSDVMCIESPFRTATLVNTVQMMLGQIDRRLRKRKREKLRKRTEKEENDIQNAKLLLIEQNHMTEAEAYRYLQKCSM